jgi:hypothetical protein
MAKVTLATILDAMKKRDTRDDVRFEFIKEQIQANRADTDALRIEMRAEFTKFRSEMKDEFVKVRSDMSAEFVKVRSEMSSEFVNVRSEMGSFRQETRSEFALVRAELKAIREQTAHITERVVTLERASGAAPGRAQ